ncbi:MAG: hypothetical protein GKR93_19435 [Gammaproteobacteria bacterium]|nr:hypothetical protein [Gammaproteobacteria bacterium]
MHRPDSIYIPIIVDAPIFILGYIAFAILSLFCVTPLRHLLLSKCTHKLSWLLFSIGIALGGTAIVIGLELFGHKSSIFHRAYIFGSLFPLFVLAATTCYYQKPSKEKERPNETPDT